MFEAHELSEGDGRLGRKSPASSSKRQPLHFTAPHSYRATPYVTVTVTMLPTQVTIAREEASLSWPGSAAPALLRSRFHSKLPGSGYVPDTGPAFSFALRAVSGIYCGLLGFVPFRC
jgi:hypothetical protein